MTAAMKAWLSTRPPAVRAMVRRYPAGARFDVGGVPHYVTGYSEWAGGGLIVSPVNPADDYDGALAARVDICPDHL